MPSFSLSPSLPLSLSLILLSLVHTVFLPASLLFSLCTTPCLTHCTFPLFPPSLTYAVPPHISSLPLPLSTSAALTARRQKSLVQSERQEFLCSRIRHFHPLECSECSSFSSFISISLFFSFFFLFRITFHSSGIAMETIRDERPPPGCLASLGCCYSYVCEKPVIGFVFNKSDIELDKERPNTATLMLIIVANGDQRQSQSPQGKKNR